MKHSGAVCMPLFSFLLHYDIISDPLRNRHKEATFESICEADFVTEFLHSLNSSWFEKVHPLHEPKDPSHHDATTKPLLPAAQVDKPATSSRPQPNKLKKNYNSKKSLGIKSIRTQRGEHEGMNNRENSGKVQIDVKSSTAKKDEKKTTQRSSSEEGNLTPERLRHHKQCSFTPPWINSPHNRPGKDTSH